ncbi:MULTISPECIES: 7-dehydrocholesterol reductase [Parachlamydia]|jgi:7-dehydrocholesterol reductase|uniref:7-dehydrocholesterol reductase n=1 Tax=Parachlamydia TaxID=83551 RepID=UPI000AF8D17C|nr:7-dehydrocholesterol reductase [Parachlamydia acanthamoebae]
MRSTPTVYDHMRTSLKTLVPFLLITLCPPSAILFWYTNVSLDGSFVNLWQQIQHQGFFPLLYEVWSPFFFGTQTAWTILAIFAASQLFFMKALPGKIYQGPITPKGNVPIYKANGPFAYFLTLTLFLVCSYGLEWFSPTILYDNLGPLLGALNIFSLFFCLFLYIKGYVAPSSSDAGASGNPIFDYYWGTELFPRLLGWDVKMFTNCRFGMMSWPLLLISFAAKQQELYGLSDSMVVAVLLQLIYITKFFFWETGYLRSLDIMHDRAGYYICWGCLVWVPGVYTSPTLYLVNHPNHLGLPLAALIFALGAVSIMINYLADRQRQKVRESDGNCTVWGKKPFLTVANYTTGDGKQKKNILLASGWWGISRHFHYVPEILGAFFWSVPALFANFLPYFYVVFLTILLIERAFRDDRRCALKYGEDWETYCKHVPYKIIPYMV